MIYVTIPVSEDRDDFEVYQRNQYVATVAPVTTLAEIIKHCPEVRDAIAAAVVHGNRQEAYDGSEEKLATDYINSILNQ